MLYSYNGEYPTDIPERIRLSDGSTRTDSSTYTEEEIADAGYVYVEAPVLTDRQTAKWKSELREFEIVDVEDPPTPMEEVGSGFDYSDQLPDGAPQPPGYDIETEKLLWNGIEWSVVTLSAFEEQLRIDAHSAEMKRRRNDSLNGIVWRVDRYLSEVRQGLPISIPIEKLDKYIQELRDLPDQEGWPFDVKWPEMDFVDPKDPQHPDMYNTQGTR